MKNVGKDKSGCVVWGFCAACIIRDVTIDLMEEGDLEQR